MKRLYVLLFALTLCRGISFADERDSLMAVIEAGKQDTGTVKAYLRLARIELSEDHMKAIEQAELALKLAGQIQSDKFIGKSYFEIGYSYFTYGYAKEGVEYLKKALPYFEKAPHCELDLARTWNNLGNAYNRLGKNKEALDSYLTSKKISESINDRKGVAGVYNNLGNIYLSQQLPLKAREYFLTAMKMNTELDNKPWLAINLMNLGITYYDVEDYDSAEYFFLKSKALYEEMGSKAPNLSSVMQNLGNAATAKKEYVKALNYFQQALDFNKEIGNESNNCLLLSNIASAYIERFDFLKARQALEQAVELSKKYDNLSALKVAYETFSILSEKTGDYKAAHEYYKKFTALKDSLSNADIKTQMEKMEETFKEEKQQKEIEFLTQKNQMQESRSKMILWFSVGAGVLLLMLIAGMYRRYQLKQKANRDLELRNIEIELQKNIIEEKNKDISDSIYYAKQIQSTLLPNPDEIKKVFPEFFIMFRPKNIVSGDFYWFANRGSRVMIAAADCTGHGVPGAFMSMIGIDKLNQAILEINLSKPSDILSSVNLNVKAALKQNEEHTASRDGMDIALCSFDLQRMRLEFAGANRPLWIVRDGQLLEYSSTKAAVGGITSEMQEFINHEVEIRKGDHVYLFSDGYADQFGGDKGKKMMTRNFKKLLVSIYDKAMQSQKDLLEETLDQWKGHIEQLDDILVIGIKV
ncbi:MAG: tetratricopeptide repeat protein [Bacteroidota bacterium]